MINRLRLVLAIVAVAVAAPNPIPRDGVAYAAKTKKKRRKKKAKPAPAPAPAAAQPAPAEAQPAQPSSQPAEIEINPSEQPGEAPVEITPEEAASQPAGGGAAPAPGEPAEQHASWKDVVVVMRKPFLKASRFELSPSWNVTLNDNMIRHHAFNAQLSYWLTDVLAIGVEGQLYRHFGFLEPHELVGTAYQRLPTLNEYRFGAALNFHYAPIYAKFAVFNKWLVHWEGMFTAGVGVTETHVLPRNMGFPGWNNFLITPNVGFTARVFLTRWITLNLGVKDYIFVDKFENVNRVTADVEDAKANATSQLINNIMFEAGVSFFVPPSFHYTTFR